MNNRKNASCDGRVVKALDLGIVGKFPHGLKSRHMAFSSN